MRELMNLNVDNLILQALREDITSEDITTNSVMPEFKLGEVDLICKQDGVIAGLDVFKRVFELLDSNVTFDMQAKDGDTVTMGQHLGKITGDIRVLLEGERTALNYLQRMSGIATYTHSIAVLFEGSKTKLLDTRKTTPNMRVFEKYAVKVGGGYNHRYNLSDGILLKDNHIGAAGSVTKAVHMAQEYAPFVRKIEVECENLDMVAANNVKTKGAGFQGDTNVLTLITQDEDVSLQLMSKEDAANIILDKILSIMKEREQ